MRLSPPPSARNVGMPVEPLLLDSQFESFILFIGPISSIFDYATFFCHGAGI
jgi:hypothetical protein